MLSDAVRLVSCPLCLGSEVHLSRPHTEGDSVMLPAPMRCRSCAIRFYQRTALDQLRMRAAGRPRRSVSESLPTVEPDAPAILVVDDSIPFYQLLRGAFQRRGFAVFGAKSPGEGMALFQAHQAQIGLAVVGLVTPTAANLDLTSDMEHLRPGLPVLYLVGKGRSIARCSIEAQAPESVLPVPFTEEQLIARIGGLLDVDEAASQRRHKRQWERLVDAPDWTSSGTKMLHFYDLRQAPLAAGHMAMLSAGKIHHAIQATNCEAAPYSMTVRAGDVARARCVIEQASTDGRFIAAA